MATKVTVKAFIFKDPAWSKAEATPGEAVELRVTAKDLEGGLEVHFEISGASGRVDLVKGKADGDLFKAAWQAPNPPGTEDFAFDAVLRQIPTPANAQRTVRKRITSGKLKVRGYRVAVDLAKVDACFVPKQEKLNVGFKVEDAAGAAKAGRYEIWGERYPSNKPLYAEDFVPAAGDATWGTWDGKAKDGVLAGKYITPEFSPYRVRVVIGPDAAAVKDPRGAGRGKVSISEAPFDVRVQSLAVRLMTGLAAATTTQLGDALAIEPRAASGAFAATGRLPNAGEVGRLRVPCERHTLITDSLDQGGDTVAGPYYSAGSTKWTRDSGLYSRPELPIELEARLASRDPLKNGAPGFGLFEPAAVGPLRVEPFADDSYPDAIVAVAGAHGAYWTNAIHKVKRGTHNAPVNSGGNPVIGYWQARFKIAADGDRDLNLGAVDAAFQFTMGSDELTVYLNRTKLVVGAAGAAGVDVEEVSATRLRLAANVTKANDIVWVVRNDTAAVGAAVVANWTSFPPGANCHAFYGGIRGAAPNNLFRDRFSPAPAAPRAAIIGRDAAAFPFTAGVRLDPDGVGAARERVEAVALTGGAKQGLAGIIFSSSHMAGDSYVLGAQIHAAPYDRALGFVAEKPRVVTRLGALTVWRVMTISTSQRLPDVGTAGLAAAVGSPAETALAARAYRGDGVNMDMGAMNAELANVFNEWVVPPVVAPATDVHTNVNLANYVAAHDGAGAAAGAGTGAVTIGAVANVTNQFVQFDHYRVQLPPGVPPGSQAAITAAVNALPAGSTSLAAMGAASGALAAPAAPAGGTPIFPGNSIGYFNWILGVTMSIGGTILDTLTPRDATPRTMSVVRWPDFYQVTTWFNGAPVGGAYGGGNTTNLHLLGFCRGHGQSFFATVSGTADTFSHEMGHSLHLVHFAAMNFGWKHHDLRSPDCKMSYTFTHGFIPQPAGAVGPVGALAADDTGWPDTMPAAIPPGSPTPTGYVAGNPTIDCTVLVKPGRPAALPIGTFCARCALKLRGWNEASLPSAWRHPDLF